MSNATDTLDALIEFLRSLDDKSKKYIFEKVFVGGDSTPLSSAESASLKKGLSEYKQGVTTKWPVGE